MGGQVDHLLACRQLTHRVFRRPGSRKGSSRRLRKLFLVELAQHSKFLFCAGQGREDLSMVPGGSAIERIARQQWLGSRTGRHCVLRGVVEVDIPH